MMIPNRLDTRLSGYDKRSIPYDQGAVSTQKAPVIVTGAFVHNWLGWEDLNPHVRSQSPLSYR